VRLASDMGCDGLAVEAGAGGCALDEVPGLVAEAAGAGLVCPALFGPIPPERLAPGKRLPHLCAWDDKEERLAAVRLAGKAMEIGRSLGVLSFAFELGPVKLALPAGAVRRLHARGALDEDEPGQADLARLLEERRRKSARVLDASRAALEGMVHTAERLAATLLLPVARVPWAAPSPREAGLLLSEFAGAPLRAVVAPARRAALAALGMPGAPDRWAAIEEAVGLTLFTDAVGLDADLAPGLGELDYAPLAGRALEAPAVVSGRPDTSVAEAIAARELVTRLRRPPPAP
jgi:hypothetical protein